MTFTTTILAALFVAILWRMFHANYRQTKAGRARLLDDCAKLLHNPQLSANATAYAKLEGEYQGYRVHMILEEDHVVMRKIPSLWLHVLVESQRPAAGSLDILARPQNTEFYSPSWNWDGRITPLSGWPTHANYRSQDVSPDLQLLDPHVRDFFTDEKAKELLVMPKTVRLTYQAKQAERGEYLLLRSANFDHEPVPQDLAQPLLERAISIRRDLDGVGA